MDGPRYHGRLGWGGSWVAVGNALLLYAKLVDGLLGVFLTRVEHYRWEVGMVGTVGEVLALQADGASTREGGSVLSLVAVGPVVRIELYARAP